MSKDTPFHIHAPVTEKAPCPTIERQKLKLEIVPRHLVRSTLMEHVETRSEDESHEEQLQVIDIIIKF